MQGAGPPCKGVCVWASAWLRREGRGGEGQPTHAANLPVRGLQTESAVLCQCRPHPRGAAACVCWGVCLVATAQSGAWARAYFRCQRQPVQHQWQPCRGIALQLQRAARVLPRSQQPFFCWWKSAPRISWLSQQHCPSLAPAQWLNGERILRPIKFEEGALQVWVDGRCF